MTKNLENICRVCLNNGSRNIFEKSSASNDSQFSIHSIGANVSSLDHLVEKLRYVTMLKVDECENLPKNMCDSCIIQLNVAYNLKKNAIQSDMKLRQYMIEFGMNVTSYTSCSINTVSVIRPPAILLPASTTSESVTITTAKSTTVSPASATAQSAPPTAPPAAATVAPSQQPQTQASAQPQQIHRPFPVMPVIIKEEPVDYDEMSDITVNTNAEAYEEHLRTHQNGTNGIHSTTSTGSSSNKSLTPLPIHSMVSVNSKSLLLSTQVSTDSEYISAYMVKPTKPTANSDKTTKTKRTASKQKGTIDVISLAVPKSKKIQSKNSTITTTTTTTTATATINVNGNANGKKSNRTGTKHRYTELQRLHDDSTIRSPIIPLSPVRQTRQQLKSPTNNKQIPRFRSRNDPPKIDYKSFFTLRRLSPTITAAAATRRISIDGSIARRKQRSPTTKTRNNKTKPSPTSRKRRYSVSQDRTRI